jgi:hypothetical protein
VAGNDSFLDHIPALIGAALGAVGASIGLSYFGVAGTVFGLVSGTLITGAVAWWVERLIRRTSARAKALAAARQRKGAPLSDSETQYIRAVADEHHKRRHARIPWQVAALGGGAALGIAGLVLVIIALGVGRPVGAIAHPPAPTHSTHPPTPATTSVVPATVPASTSAVPTTAPPTAAPATTPAPTPDGTVGGTASTAPPTAAPAVTASPSAT